MAKEIKAWLWLQCDVLGPGLVRRERVLTNEDEPVVMVRPFTMVPNVIELSYYSSALLSRFVLDSVVGECDSGPIYYAPCGNKIIRLK
jgi:hypothetical protein